MERSALKGLPNRGATQRGVFASYPIYIRICSFFFFKKPVRLCIGFLDMIRALQKNFDTFSKESSSFVEGAPEKNSGANAFWGGWLIL